MPVRGSKIYISLVKYIQTVHIGHSFNLRSGEGYSKVHSFFYGCEHYQKALLQKLCSAVDVVNAKAELLLLQLWATAGAAVGNSWGRSNSWGSFVGSW